MNDCRPDKATLLQNLTHDVNIFDYILLKFIYRSVELKCKWMKEEQSELSACQKKLLLKVQDFFNGNILQIRQKK